VKDSGFGGVSARVTAAPPARRSDHVDVAVEIVAKPAPAYTDEARALKLEGDVLLEVDFCASGQVRVLRVVRGLGHGLDEAAARAAEGIQFKPATTRNGPVDFRAVLHITFRLT
jgi:TonB family protein